MHNVVKWPNILLKSSGVNTARFLKYDWPFYNMHKRVKVRNNMCIEINSMLSTTTSEGYQVRRSNVSMAKF